MIGLGVFFIIASSVGTTLNIVGSDKYNRSIPIVADLLYGVAGIVLGIGLILM